ncbi:MAG: hypothetical protein GQ569_02910 [Methylococcaceae bacterium]|nr:hypothetical protein [Methylococcaceae bacterium]
MQQPEFSHQSWEEAMHSLTQFEVTKYCNFNLKNMIYLTENKHTFEVRILPVWLDGQSIIEAVGLFEGILNWAIESPKQATFPADMQGLLNDLPLSVKLRDIWQKQLSYS